jgi:hypothetical protein
VDYSGLQILVLEAVKKVVADGRGVAEAQSALQLTVAGRLEQLAAAVERLEAAAAGGSGGGLAGSSASTSTAVSLSGGPSGDEDEATLERLMDSEDVEMSSGSGGEEEMGESEAGSGGGATSSASDPAGELAGLSDEQVADWLMQSLHEQAGARGLYLVSRVRARQWFA